MSENSNSISYLRFPHKLWFLLNSSADAIKWGTSGKTILINHFILDAYLQCDQSIFKTTHISSFIRQLNLYGFRKVTSHLQDPSCNASNPDVHEYIHDDFQLGKIQPLQNIKRKSLNFKKHKVGMRLTPHTVKNGSLCQCHPCFRECRQELQGLCSFEVWILFGQKFISNRLLKARQLFKDALKNAALQCKQSANISTCPEIAQDNQYPQHFPTETSLQNTPNISSYIQNFRASDSSSEDNDDADESHINSLDYCESFHDFPQVEDTNNPEEYVVVMEAMPNSAQNEYHAEVITDEIYTVNPEYVTPNYDEYMMDFQNKDEVYTTGEADNEMDPLERNWEYGELLEDFGNRDISENSTEMKELYTQISQTIEILNA